MSDVLIAQEVGTVVVIETAPAELLEVVAVGPQGPVGDVNPQMPVILAATEAARDAALASEQAASASQSAAATSAANAATSESNAATSAATATAQATASANSATSSANSATAAQAAQTATESARDTTLATIGTAALKANNLSDLANAATARSNLGLGNVNNTSDANKPVSTAQQSALDLKLNTSGGTITANSTDPALKITQTGAGNALVVGDAASDTTPFVVASDGGVSIGTTAAAGANTLRVVNTLLATDRLEINSQGTGNRYAYVDLVGDDTYTDFGARLIRDNAGANAATQLVSRGTGDLTIKTIEAGALSLATTNTERMRIEASGNVGVGVSTAIAKLDIGAADNANEGAEVKLRGATNAVVDWNFDVFQSAFRLFTTDKGTGTNWQGRLSISHDTGTMVQMGSGVFVGHAIRNNAASATVTGHSYIDFHNELGFPTGSIIGVHATDGSGRMDFLATSPGARNSDRRATVFQIYGNGNALAVSPNGGLGYGTGAGGTVTQATSKSTAVTLNKPTGQITMHNAALAAGASVIFQLTCDKLSGEETLIVSPIWNAINVDNYRVEVVGVGVGAAKIRVTNLSAGSLSDALVINYAIIKGAIA